jgi:hypothetical protein
MPGEKLRKRFVVDDMDIRGRIIFATEVEVLNISSHGISVKAERRLDIGSEYPLKLVEGERAVALKGTVVWSSIHEHRDGPHGDVVPVYSAGMTFSELVSEKMDELIDFIGEHLEGEEHRREGLRVTITIPERAILYCPSAYRVKKLSMNDMLIECAEEIGIGLRLPMEMSLPEDRPLLFSGRIVSCCHVHEKGSDHFDVEVSFVKMEEKESERLKEFIGILDRIDDIS